MKRTNQKLILFDIDGTIMMSGKASRRSLAAAIKEVLQIDVTFDGYEFSGKTDPQILWELLEITGIDERRFKDVFPKLMDFYFVTLEKILPDSPVEVLPGVEDILKRLKIEKNIHLGLVTGNSEKGARLKLNRIEMNDYFPFGAFGSDSAVRDELPPIALRRAQAYSKKNFHVNDIFVIGDSIHDIRCSRSIRAKSIAVATGFTPLEELQKENPDHLFRDFSNINDVISVLLD